MALSLDSVQHMARADVASVFIVSSSSGRSAFSMRRRSDRVRGRGWAAMASRARS